MSFPEYLDAVPAAAESDPSLSRGVHLADVFLAGPDQAAGRIDDYIVQSERPHFALQALVNRYTAWRFRMSGDMVDPVEIAGLNLLRRAAGSPVPAPADAGEEYWSADKHVAAARDTVQLVRSFTPHSTGAMIRMKSSHLNGLAHKMLTQKDN